MRTRRPVAAAVLRLALPLAIAGAAAPARAQAPEKFENLQVLPKDIPRDSLIQVMRGFAFALGVRCEHCHVQQEGQQPPFRFAADDKAPKATARFMMRMVDSLNRAILPKLADRRDPPVQISCVTCHRGLEVPTTLEMALLEPMDRWGADSAIARYKALRQDMASGHYDFGEWSVNEIARRLDARGKPAEAIALYAMNQEYYPNSPSIDIAIGDIQLRLGDRDKAIVRYRAALAKQPNNQQAKRKLAQLGVN